MEVDASLNITRDRMLLCIYDLNQIRNFFPVSKDGLAIELLSFKNQFSCGNDFVPKANTRNRFSYLDGELMKPIYRNEIEKHINESNDFDKSVGVIVGVEKFSDSSIDMRVRCFTASNSFKTWLEVKEKLAIEIKQIVEKNNAAFAFPSQSIYIEKK